MNIKICISVLLILAAVSLYHAQDINPDLNKDFDNFRSRFKRKYGNGTKEHMRRRRTWESNVKAMQKHNLEYFLGEKSYSMGINQFSDMTLEEFKSIYLPRTINVVPKNDSSPPRVKRLSLPYSVDWRSTGYVTPVKDQSSCGSCWAFSAIGSIEGQYYRKTGRLVRFSEQQLVDCSYSNYGCNGGLMTRAFQYVTNTGGIQMESDYPYTGRAGTCRFTSSKVGAYCLSYTELAQNEYALAYAVANIGPISVGIDASRIGFQYYRSGIYDDPYCSSYSVNHAVLVVGYGVSSDGREYWIVKNSWGTYWGQSGYIYMAKNKGNRCGIASLASYPNVNPR